MVTHDRRNILMAFRMEDLHPEKRIDGTIEGTCRRCSRAIALAPSALEFMKTYPDSIAVCLQCGSDKLDEVGGHVNIETNEMQTKELGSDAPTGRIKAEYLGDLLRELDE